VKVFAARRPKFRSWILPKATRGTKNKGAAEKLNDSPVHLRVSRLIDEVFQSIVRLTLFVSFVTFWELRVVGRNARRVDHGAKSPSIAGP
jgi:hypothetical protein